MFLTPLTGTILFVMAVVCGHRFRKNWKQQQENWQAWAWFYGVFAGGALLALGFIPLKF